MIYLKFSFAEKDLHPLSLNGCLVSIDAIGCQKAISDKIIEEGADYLLAVKDNQTKLKKAIRAIVSLRKPEAYVNPVIDYCEECHLNPRFKIR